jgi:hypothetical protein
VKLPRRETVGGRIYQVKITLKGIRPPIWRRVQVRGTIRLADLHHVIQTVFSWTDTHLHQFLINGRSYGQSDEFDEEVVDEETVTLAEAVGTRTKRFTKSSSRRSLGQIRAANDHYASGASGAGHRRTVAARWAIGSFSTPSVIRVTRSMKLCSTGWVAFLMRRRSISRR